MERITNKGNKLVFKTETNEVLANAIRRGVNQIVLTAIDEVEIIKNDSPLYDETIAHRLGLIPLKQNSKKQGKLKLSSKEEGFVYSGKLKGDFEVVYEKMPITLLNKGQEIELVAHIKEGQGKEHAKFSPGIINYRQIMEIITDKDIAEKAKELVPDLEIKMKGDKAIIMDNSEKEIGDFCEGASEKKGKKIEVNPTKEILFSVESFGQISEKDIFVKSIEALKKELNEFSKKLK